MLRMGGVWSGGAIAAYVTAAGKQKMVEAIVTMVNSENIPTDLILKPVITHHIPHTYNLLSDFDQRYDYILIKTVK